MRSVHSFIITICLCLLVCGSVSATEKSAKEKLGRRLVFAEDTQSIFEAPTDQDPLPFIRNFLTGEVSHFPVTTFSFLASTPDMCFFDSKVGEVWGDRPEAKAKEGKAGPTIRAFRTQGTDVLKVAAEIMHPRGIEMIAEIRMSDTHYPKHDPANPHSPRFGQEHPEFVIKQPDGRTNETALDYSFPEVRAHRLAIMRELAEERDIDGIELNFVRWGKHFPNDQGREKASIMTDFVGEIRGVLDSAAAKRNRGRLSLAVRVPEGIRECWLAGLDPETWVRKGWIDYLVVSTWNESDPQLPVHEFAKFTAGTDCELLAAMGNMMMGSTGTEKPEVKGRGSAQSERPGYVSMLLTPAEARGCAANHYARGANEISLWNVGTNFGTEGRFSGESQHARAVAWINAVATPEKVYEGPRCYHYLPLNKNSESKAPPLRNYPFAGKNQSPLGAYKTQILEFPPEETGQRKAYKFYMADGRNGEPLRGMLRFWAYYLTPDDDLTVDINGKPIESSKINRIVAGELRAGLPGVRYEISLTDCPPFQGDNELGLTLKSKPSLEKIPLMEELEIVVE